VRAREARLDDAEPHPEVPAVQLFLEEVDIRRLAEAVCGGFAETENAVLTFLDLLRRFGSVASGPMREGDGL
jgi:hypothetical protein